MALLAKYYLTYSSPMNMENDLDTARRKNTYDRTWRPPPVMHNSYSGTFSAPNSPRIQRKFTWNSGYQCSCDCGDNQTMMIQHPKLDGVRHSSPLVRRFSQRNRSRTPGSAPTSPGKEFNTRSNSDTKVPGKFGDGSRSMTPVHQNSDPTSGSRFSPPTKYEPASGRRSRYASHKHMYQSYSGVTNGFSFSSSTSSPPSSAGSQCDRHRGEATGIRPRCSSGPEDKAYRKITPQHKKPELLVTVSYSKNASFITATINKARNVPSNSGAFVRVHLYDGFKPISLKHTSIVQGGPEVEFKQAFMFSLAKDSLWATHILVELFEYDVIGKECKTGDVVIGPKANGSGFSQWKQMCTHPNIPCSTWHVVT